MNKSPPAASALFTRYIRAARTGRRIEARILLADYKAKLKEQKMSEITESNGTEKKRQTRAAKTGGG